MRADADQTRFTTAITTIINRGEYPNGARINRILGRGGRYLSATECQWRRETAHQLGFRLYGQNLDGTSGNTPPRTERKRPRRHMRPKTGDTP